MRPLHLPTAVTAVTAITLLLAACSNSTPEAPHHGETVRIVEGTVDDYEGAEAVLRAYRRGGLVDDAVVGEGRILSDGTFSLELDEIVDADGYSGFICDEDPVGSEPGASGVPAEFLVMASATSTSASPEGELVLATPDFPALPEGPYDPDDAVVQWFYATEDVVIDRTCENGARLDLDLKAGWNTVLVTTIPTSGTGSVRTQAPPDDLVWQFVPMEP